MICSYPKSINNHLKLLSQQSLRAQICISDKPKCCPAHRLGPPLCCSGVICGVQYSHCCPPACPCASPCGTRSPPSGSACSSLVFPQSPRSPRPTALPPTGTERRVAPGTPSRSSLWETQWSEVTHHAAGTQEAPPCFKPAYRHHRQGLDHSVIGYVQFALLDFPSATLHSVQWL